MSNCIFAFMYSFDVQTACQSFSRRLMLRAGSFDDAGEQPNNAAKSICRRFQEFSCQA